MEITFIRRDARIPHYWYFTIITKIDLAISPALMTELDKTFGTSSSILLRGRQEYHLFPNN